MIFEDYINRDRPFDMVVTLISENDGSIRIHGNFGVYEYKTVKGARIALARRGYTLYRKRGEE